MRKLLYVCLIYFCFYSCTHKPKSDLNRLLERDVPKFIEGLQSLTHENKVLAFEQMRRSLQYGVVDPPSSPGSLEAETKIKEGKSRLDGQLVLLASPLVPHADSNEFAINLIAFPTPEKGKVKEIAENSLKSYKKTLKDGKECWEINNWLLMIDDQSLSYRAISDKSVEDYFDQTRMADTDTIDITDYTDHESVTFAFKDQWPKPTRFTEAQTNLLQRALEIANGIIRDTLFKKVLWVLSANHEIEWGTQRLSQIPVEGRQNPTEFILNEFETKGLSKIGDFKASIYRPGSTTTGSAFACSATINVNVNKLNRSLPDIAGTIVHERVHSFCQTHRYNSRSGDGCDMAYHAGSVCIAIYFYRANRSMPYQTSGDMCNALKKRLKDMGIIK